MSTDGARHPRDAHGRILPAANWRPERAAPGELELLRRFCNSVNRENGADRFATARGFDAWLLSEGLPATRPNRDALAGVVAFRDALHTLTVANQQKRPPADAWADLADVVSDVTFRLHGGDGLELVAVSPSRTIAFLGRLTLICQRAHYDGTLRRLKSCSHCEWTIYDASKNESARWCSMNACGGRHNARTYRQRKHR
jgi:predicted RNA-binding Zn ribbon-like protein